MNGLEVDTDEGWTATTYYDELIDEDVELSLEEQVDIQMTWSEIQNLVRRKKEDPTSKWNSDL